MPVYYIYTTLFWLKHPKKHISVMKIQLWAHPKDINKNISLREAAMLPMSS